MCNELDRIAFCIWRIIDLHLSPTSSFIFCSISFEQSSRTSMMMLYWLTLYSGYRFISSSLSLLYFVVFSKSLDSLFSSHGQLISITLTCLLVLSMIAASILLAFTRVVSANNGTSQAILLLLLLIIFLKLLLLLFKRLLLLLLSLLLWRTKCMYLWRAL